jgi:pimeloyl-ACP methyl ester carboxylesterase
MLAWFQRKVIALAIVPLLLLLGGQWLFRSTVAYAIAFAPNGRPLAGQRRHSDPVPDRATPLRLEVGPPTASLALWVMQPEQPRNPASTIVLLHGVRLDKSSLLPFARAFVEHGHRAVLVDLRGHGDSTGTYLTYGSVESKDVSRIIDELERRHGTGQVGLFGYSYGGAVALHAAARDPRVAGVVAVASFASLRQVVSDYESRFFPAFAPWIPAAWLDAAVDDAGRIAEFDPNDAPATAVSRSLAPLLVIHGGSDTQVPPRHARELTQSAGPRAELVTLEGSTHESILSDEDGKVRRISTEWFGRNLGRGGKGR